LNALSCTLNAMAQTFYTGKVISDARYLHSTLRSAVVGC
jgi:hypothetical protein